MVAMKQLFDTDGIDFIAGRSFLLYGVAYRPGDTIDADVVRGCRNRESLLRSNRVMAVSDDLNALPRYFQREVKDRAIQLKKFGLTESGSAGFQKIDVGAMTINEGKLALANKSAHTWLWAVMSEIFRDGGPRQTFITWMQENSPVDVDKTGDPEFYLDGGPLVDWTDQAFDIGALSVQRAPEYFQDGEYIKRTVADTQKILTEVFEYVEAWAWVLLWEINQDEPRSTLVDFIKAGRQNVPAEAIETLVLSEEAYAQGAPLELWAYPADAESAYPA